MKKKFLMIVMSMVCAFSTVSTGLAQPVAVEAAAKKTPKLSKVYSAVKKAYGDNYLPNVRLSDDDIKTRYGISSSWYTGAVAEIPMISSQVDELVIVKAKNTASRKKIKSALTAYQSALKEDTMNYPMNQLKIQASRIYVKGNYVCFFMLGSLSSSQEEQEESKVIAAYRAQNAKAVTAIQKLYK
jgi:hypothetical protein